MVALVYYSRPHCRGKWVGNDELFERGKDAQHIKTEALTAFNSLTFVISALRPSCGRANSFELIGTADRGIMLMPFILVHRSSVVFDRTAVRAYRALPDAEKDFQALSHILLCTLPCPTLPNIINATRSPLVYQALYLEPALTYALSYRNLRISRPQYRSRRARKIIRKALLRRPFRSMRTSMILHLLEIVADHFLAAVYADGFCFWGFNGVAVGFYGDARACCFGLERALVIGISASRRTGKTGERTFLCSR